jgi:hypothetical protein
LTVPANLDRAAEQQQFFGEGGLAGVGMGDDGEGTPPVELVEEGGHQSIKKWCSVWKQSRKRADST